MDIRQKFFTISPRIQKQDNYIHLRILQSSFIQSIPPSDRCCFLEHIIHFYMDKVFSHYHLLDTDHVKTISQIANSFCELFGSPRACQVEFIHTCKDVTMLNLGAIETNFKKLPHNKAILKAIGELDILLSWMDGLH
ncbi:interleukin-20-like [Leptodactylus fuscus]